MFFSRPYAERLIFCGQVDTSEDVRYVLREMTKRTTVYAEALSTIRQLAGYTLRGLAKEADVSRSYLSDIELGKRVPSPKIAKKLAAALGVPVTSFFAVRPKQPSHFPEGHTIRGR